MPLVDAVAYQGQLLEQQAGEDATISKVKEEYAFVKSVSPNTKFNLQLWVGRETPEVIVDTFNKLKGNFDTAVIGANPGTSASEILTVVNGIN